MCGSQASQVREDHDFRRVSWRLAAPQGVCRHGVTHTGESACSPAAWTAGACASTVRARRPAADALPSARGGRIRWKPSERSAPRPARRGDAGARRGQPAGAQRLRQSFWPLATAGVGGAARTRRDDAAGAARRPVYEHHDHGHA